ncbi:MAG: 2-oxo acid dehydrogenase subunit E2 [Thermoleophilia bacterium]|jgi:pyruvate dehydrogenase E2 component (dihydrolipoamide acetyltransferase)|nr:2-oxo acid dehydrogenase subunit E2 [Thermoleophilia bacterium]
MSQFLMPKLSDTMEEGTVLRWLKDDGAEVAKGEPLVEIETDKATMTVEAPEGGTLAIGAHEGDTVPVGEPIAGIGEPAGVPAHGAVDSGDEEDTATGIPVSDDGTGSEIGLEVGEVSPGAQNAPAEDVAEAAAMGTRDAGAADGAPAPPAPAPPAPEPVAAAAPGGRVKASPLARSMAARLGIDIGRVRGTGPDGRVVRADVEAAANGTAGALLDGVGAPAPAPAPPAPPAPAPAVPAPAAAAPAPAPAPGTRTPLTRLQQTIARRMVQAMEAPPFALQRDVDATAAQALRRDLAAAAPEDARPSLNDLIVRAVALAAAERPDAISRFDGDALVAPAGVHVGVAVSVPGGLLVPVVRDAAAKSVGQIAAEVRDLARRAREGGITAAELEGSVISVSNLGMFGVDRFTAVINPPEAAILAVGRAKPAPVVVDGQVAVREVMTLTLTADHRVLYGAEAATFLGRIAELIERPHALVL